MTSHAQEPHSVPACWWGWWFEVGVLLGFLVWVEVFWGCVPGGVVDGGDGPLFFVDQVVVAGAEEGAVVRAGGAAAGPVGDVVGFAPGGGDGAVGEGAALVPGGK